jgi:hypothetical protein
MAKRFEETGKTAEKYQKKTARNSKSLAKILL